MPVVTLSAQSVHLPGRKPRPRSARPVHPIHWLEIEIGPGQVAYVLSERYIREYLPPGAVVLDCELARDGLPTIRKTPGFTSGKGRISGGRYLILDDRLEFSKWLTEKSANGQSIVNGILRQYTLERGDDATDPEVRAGALQATFQIGDHSFDEMVHTISVADVQRDLDVEVFAKRGWRMRSGFAKEYLGHVPTTLDASLRRDGETVEDYLARHSYTFEHTDDYLQDPGETIGYALIDQGERREVLSYTAVEEYSAGGADGASFSRVGLKIKARGLFGTTAQDWDGVDPETPDANKPEVRVFPYYEEDPLGLAYGMITGEMPDGRALPPGEHAGLGTKWISEASFANEGSMSRRTIRNPKKSKAGTYVADELLRFVPAVLLPNELGELEVVEQQTDGDTGTEAVLTPDNVDMSTLGEYEHDTSEIANPVTLLWDFDPITEEYGQVSIWDDVDAQIRNKARKGETYKSATITTGHHSEPQVQRFAGVMAARHANPVPRIRRVDVDEGLWHVQVGAMVQVRLPIKDYVNSTGLLRDIDRPMLIVSSSFDQNKGVMTWSLAGAIERGGDPIAAAPSISEEWFREGGRDLASVPGITITNGVASGSPTLQLDIKHYHIGDLALGSNFTPTFSFAGTFQLCVMGTLTIGCTLDVSGRGYPGGRGATATRAATHGRRHYFASRAGGGVQLRAIRDGNFSGSARRFNRLIRSLPRAAAPPPRHTAVRAPISVEGGRLIGMPTALVGSGGDGGGSSTYELYTTDGGRESRAPDERFVYPGGNGADGGGAFSFVSYPGSSISQGGRLITNGSDALRPPVIPLVPGRDTRVALGAQGAPGCRGALAWAIDGLGTQPVINGANFEARNGGYDDSGSHRLPSPAASRASYPRRGGDLWRSWYEPTTPYGPTGGRENLWSSSHVVAFVPASATVEQAPFGSLFSQFFANQRDGVVRLIIQGVQPSDANLGDMWTVQEQIDADGSPVAYVLTPEGWTLFNWNSDQFAPVYAALISLNRQYGTLAWYSDPERPTYFNDGDSWTDSSTGETWILRLSGDDELVYVGDYSAGESRVMDPRLLDRSEWIVRVGAKLFDSPRFPPTPGPTVSQPGEGYELATPSVEAYVRGPGTVELIIGPPNNRTGITGYEIRRGGIKSSGTLIATTSILSYVDDAAPSAGAYRYAVRAVGDAGKRSDDALEFIGLVEPGEAAGGAPMIRITRVTGSFGEAPKDPGDPRPDNTGMTYSIKCLDANGPDVKFEVTGAGFEGRSITITNPPENTLQVASPNISNGRATVSIPSWVGSRNLTAQISASGNAQSRNVTFKYRSPAGQALDPVRNPYVTVYSTTALELFWQAPANISNIDRINVYRNNRYVGATDSGSATSFFVSGLAPSTDYEFELRSLNDDSERSVDVKVNARTRS